MKILLHMGQEKTGTTAVQQALRLSDKMLRARGVYYPDFHDQTTAHHLLLALCGVPAKLPRWNLADLGGPDGAVRKAQAEWAAACDDIRRDPPQLLILSSELLLGRADQQAKARLFEMLSDLSDDITPVIYIRHPVDHFRSAHQEMLKGETRPNPPTGQNLRQKILDTEAVFSKPPIFVAYHPASLFGGDAVQDFANRFLAPWLNGMDLPQRRANVGLSAEALVLMSQMRAEAGNTMEAARHVGGLRNRFLEFDQRDPPEQPLTLLPEVAEAALRSATCHRWLAETGRLQIPGLDVARIDGAEVPEWMKTAAPETFFPHDPQRLARLRQWIETLPPKPAPARTAGKPLAKAQSSRLLDRLLRFLNRKLAEMNDRSTSGPDRTDDSPAP